MKDKFLSDKIFQKGNYQLLWNKFIYNLNYFYLTPLKVRSGRPTVNKLFKIRSCYFVIKVSRIFQSTDSSFYWDLLPNLPDSKVNPLSSFLRLWSRNWSVRHLPQPPSNNCESFPCEIQSDLLTVWKTKIYFAKIIIRYLLNRSTVVMWNLCYQWTWSSGVHWCRFQFGDFC